jgi:hypothetical protein
MTSLVSLFAYFGPETTLPLLSMLAMVSGAVLMVGRVSRRHVVRWARAIARK